MDSIYCTQQVNEMLNAKRIKKHQKVNSVSRPILRLDTRIHRKALCPEEESDILFGNKSCSICEFVADSRLLCICKQFCM